MHVQPSLRQDAAPHLILWDLAIPLAETDVAPASLPAEGPFPGAKDALFYDAAAEPEARADHLRLLIEMQPWAHILASGRWVPVLVDLAARHLHLCITSARLYEPRFGAGNLARYLTPLPFPTEVFAHDLRPLRPAIRAWGSSLWQKPQGRAAASRPAGAADGLCPA